MSETKQPDVTKPDVTPIDWTKPVETLAGRRASVNFTGTFPVRVEFPDSSDACWFDHEGRLEHIECLGPVIHNVAAPSEPQWTDPAKLATNGPIFQEVADFFKQGEGYNDDVMECVCRDWAIADGSRFFESSLGNGHHYDCPKQKPYVGAVSLLKDLVKGIQTWGGEEDGVPDWLWDAYSKAVYVTTGKVPDPKDGKTPAPAEPAPVSPGRHVTGVHETAEAKPVVNAQTIKPGDRVSFWNTPEMVGTVLHTPTRPGAVLVEWERGAGLEPPTREVIEDVKNLVPVAEAKPVEAGKAEDSDEPPALTAASAFARSYEVLRRDAKVKPYLDAARKAIAEAAEQHQLSCRWPECFQQVDGRDDWRERDGAKRVLAADGFSISDFEIDWSRPCTTAGVAEAKQQQAKGASK